MRATFLFSLLFYMLSALNSMGQSNWQKEIEARATTLLPKVIEWRRYIHAHPELGNREYKTMEYIAAHCRALGLTVTTGVGKTGVVALLKGGKPGPVVALRADIDEIGRAHV